ncbi:hypothetical protein EX30DRAFT_396697 [Ascodesmis nigricans]|uniref:F-box domain-containing protein n=1 Tax=Ascodesmis nigricans TaxID=341454 RepID=A0A4S2MTP6_9PEZI|nr:hypothetical protein EX30DRAFT_396697 [Ascodesmis nigricans]
MSKDSSPSSGSALSTTMSSYALPEGWAALPEHIAQQIFQYLPPASLISASRTCRLWQLVCFYSGATSRSILDPLVPLINERFGVENLPSRISPDKLRKLLVLYNRQDSLGYYSTTAFYDTTAIAESLHASTKAASSGSGPPPISIPAILQTTSVTNSMLGILAKPQRIFLFDTSTTPIRLLGKYNSKDDIVAFALSGTYLAVVTQARNLYLNQLVGRTTRSPSLYEVYCISLPKESESGKPISVSLTPDLNCIPLAAVLTTAQVWLIHRCHTITLKRENSFLLTPEVVNGDEQSGKSEGLLRRKTKRGRQMDLLRQAPMKLRKERKRREPWLIRANLQLPELKDGAKTIAPLQFTHHGHQIQISGLPWFLGSFKWDPSVQGSPDSELLFHFHNSGKWKLQQFPPGPPPTPTNSEASSPKPTVIPVGERFPSVLHDVDDYEENPNFTYIYTSFLHLHGPYYIVTCTTREHPNSFAAHKTLASTRAVKSAFTEPSLTSTPSEPTIPTRCDVRIISVRPSSTPITKLILFPFPPTTSSTNIIPRYAVHKPPPSPLPGINNRDNAPLRQSSPPGYVVFIPADGRLNVIPINMIPFEPTAKNNPNFYGPRERGWELVQKCRDVLILGTGELVKLWAGRERVVVVGVEGIRIVRLEGGVEMGMDGDGWWIDGGGKVRKGRRDGGKWGSVSVPGAGRETCKVM